MFKSKLQEYCHSKAWNLPVYETRREGPDHCSRFKAVVEVNGLSFISPEFCRNAKEAQNLAAKLAFEHLIGVSSSSTDHSTIPEGQNSSQSIHSSGIVNATKDGKRLKDGTHIYKNQLQIYAQKRNLPLPEYSIIREGPHHASRFRSTVTVEAKTYECLEFFHTIKEAESAAAKVAMMSLFPGGIQEDGLYIYKNLLQELVLKEFSCLPNYTSQPVGHSHVPIFVSTVEIKGETFQGEEAKTKKQAEMNAAKVAYTALKERRCKHKQVSGHKAMGSIAGETPEFSAPSSTLRDGTTDSNLNIVSDVQPGSNEQFELKKEATDQGVTPPGPDMGKNGASSPHSSEGASITEQQASPTVTANSGLSISLEPSIGPDGSEQRKVVVFSNGPNVKIPPGFTVLDSDENHIVVTKFKPSE